MKAYLAFVMVVAASMPAKAAEYQYMKCSDLEAAPGAISHFIGWLNLRNTGGDTEVIDFKQGISDEIALEKTCRGNGQLPLYMAVSLTFPQIEYEGRIFMDAATPTGSVR